MVLFGGDPSDAGPGAWAVVADEVATVGLPPGATLAEGVDPVPVLVGVRPGQVEQRGPPPPA